MPKLIDRQWYGQRVFEITLERDTWNFQCGDATLLVLPDHITARPYSISSSPTAEYLSFLVRWMPSGTVSHFLATCALGTNLETSPPIPQLDLNNPETMVWIATGTGISPFLSALRYNPKVYPVQLLYGIRYFEDLANQRELTTCPSLRLFVSQENVEGTCNRRIKPEDIVIDPRLRYAICGHGLFAQQATTYLLSKGIPQANVQCEVFFP
jgi:ferredoxin-NADP reductase